MKDTRLADKKWLAKETYTREEVQLIKSQIETPVYEAVQGSVKYAPDYLGWKVRIGNRYYLIEES